MIQAIWMDDSKLLQESNLTASSYAGRPITLYTINLTLLLTSKWRTTQPMGIPRLLRTRTRVASINAPDVSHYSMGFSDSPYYPIIITMLTRQGGQSWEDEWILNIQIVENTNRKVRRGCCWIRPVSLQEHWPKKMAACNACSIDEGMAGSDWWQRVCHHYRAPLSHLPSLTKPSSTCTTQRNINSCSKTHGKERLRFKQKY